MKRGALVIDRQGMAGLADARIEFLVAERQRPDPEINAFAEFIDRQAVSVHGIPQAEKLDLRDWDGWDRAHLAALPTDEIFQEHERVTDRSGQRVQPVIFGLLDAEFAI